MHVGVGVSAGMTVKGEYEESGNDWHLERVRRILQTGTTDSVTVFDRPVILVTMLGAKSGKVRKIPLMRVEHDGAFAAVASKGGAPDNPGWYGNLVKHPEVDVQDGTQTGAYRARELQGAERDAWWARCVEAYPPYADYQTKTSRLIPVFALERA